MHPILFNIPLPKMPLKLWWALAAVALIGAVYLALGLRRRDKNAATLSLVVAAGAGIAGWVFRDVKYEATSLPIYSYGVMLGLSLVVGWYLTLALAERDGLPKETMANCYVVTAIAAILGSRVLYVVTNPDEFTTAADFFALRRGGLVAYGGFLGGYIGSWAYLRAHRIRLMPWADVAVPSLASGLLITRIGCYLFGCDFGKRLPDTAPAWLKKLGTFPQWSLDGSTSGGGSPAYLKHLSALAGTPLGEQVKATKASLPVHPTQIYESLVGLTLLVLLLWQRKNQKFRGQIFFLFAFAYGFLRFLLEILRDDSERGEFGPQMGEHWLVAGSLFLFALAFTFGISLGIKNQNARTAARVLSFVPAIVAFVVLKPASFAKQTSIQLSTSQWIGLLSALLVAFFYAKFWEAARKSPRLAMGRASLGDFDDDAGKKPADGEEDGERKKKKKKAKAEPDAVKASEPKAAAAEESPVEEEGDEEGDDGDGDGDDAPTGDDKVEDKPAAKKPTEES